MKCMLRVFIPFIFIICIFCFGMSVSAVSITVDTSSNLVTNTGTITISSAKENDTLQAYKILDAFYNSTTNVVTYDFTSDFKRFMAQSTNYRSLTTAKYFQLTSGDITSGSTQTSSTLDKLVSEYATYISNNSVTGITLDNDAGIVSGTVPVGAYLIFPTVTLNVYGVMVGNVTLGAGTDSNWVVKNSSIVAKVSDVSFQVITGASSIAIGTSFKISTLLGVPKYPTNAINTVYTFYQELDNGITVPSVSNITITDGGTTLTNTNGTFTNSSGNVEAVATVSGQKITITFTAINVSNSSVNVTYKTSLNENATLGVQNTNNIKGWLVYSNDPYGTGTKTTDTITKSIKTYGLKVVAVAADDVSKTLAGVKFEVWGRARAQGRVDEEKVATIVTDSDGVATLTGYNGNAYSNYYIKQISTVPGYKLASDTSYSTSLNTDGYQTVTIKIPVATILPVTGGIGTLIFTFLGFIIIIVSVILFSLYRKK